MIGCPHKEERKNADQEFFQVEKKKKRNLFIIDIET